MKVWTSRTHDCKDDCICTTQSGPYGGQTLVRLPGCPVSGHTGAVSEVSFSPDGTRVVSVSTSSSDGWGVTLKIWDATGAEVSSFMGVS